MARRKPLAPALDGPPPRILQLLEDFSAAQQMGTHDIHPDHWPLARRSGAFRALIRASRDHPDPDDLRGLTLMWEWLGGPAGKSPRDWRAAGGVEWLDGQVEDRGEAGVFGTREAAGWYAHFLDPVGFDVCDCVALLYE